MRYRPQAQRKKDLPKMTVQFIGRMTSPELVEGAVLHQLAGATLYRGVDLEMRCERDTTRATLRGVRDFGNRIDVDVNGKCCSLSRIGVFVDAARIEPPSAGPAETLPCQMWIVDSFEGTRRLPTPVDLTAVEEAFAAGFREVLKKRTR
jgi:hypothetical protein